ncbi:cell division control 14 SIN component [Venturia nashicola]|uniref:Cell division control SIN component n=1 Tax=Venturia nashicola TaxID=86259 RepID=A0A4Z1PBK5_9PEZI|nr:cell division control SIN component [Venturia nashicola]TLD29653.1 cell division control 14 SIN component [Venturia nashicola]
METLLSLAFDNISSKDSSKLRKGLRQIEGLLAQICLSQKTSPGHNRRASVVPSPTDNISTRKTLQDLPSDPAFREFFRLQDSFEYNVSSRLIATLERLLSTPPGTSDMLILSTLQTLQGTLLLHPPSRHHFSLSINMTLLLDLLDSTNPAGIQSSALLVLVSALLGEPRNARAFENEGGLEVVTSLLGRKGTDRRVKGEIVEFLWFWLSPETPPTTTPESSPPVTAVRMKRSKSPLSNSTGAGLEPGSKQDQEDDGRGSAGQKEPRSIKFITKTTEQKHKDLAKYLSNVDDLVRDLHESAPFATPSNPTATPSTIAKVR